MLDFGRFSRRQSLVKFLAVLRKDLNEAICKNNKPSEKFITYASLEDIWTDNRLGEFVYLVRPGFDRDQIPFVKKRLLRTLSILVYIRWTEKWELFGPIFLHRNDRLDDRIPYYTLDTLSEFLSPIDASLFNSERWTFYPILLEEGKSHEFSGDWRLPFINPESSPIAIGGYGQVTKELIASRQFVACSSLCLAPNQEALPVARKRYANRADFRRETSNLKFLRSGLCHHKHIVSYLAIVVVGYEYNLLSPLAEMDLDQFLRGEFGKKFPSVSLPDLVGEARNIVGALAFLHEMLQTDHPGLACCHNDLKPANILVFDQGSSPVGTWKITDFGISIIAEPGEHPGAILEMSPDGSPTFHHQPARPASTYQAPEVSEGGEIGRKSDVWSLGCILVRILALGIDGLDGLNSLDMARAVTMVGEHFGHDYFHRGSPPYLNPHIERWLEGLPDRGEDGVAMDFWMESRALLRDMLTISKPARPSAKAVFDRLYRIKRLAPCYTSFPSPSRLARPSFTPSSSQRSRLDSVSPRTTPLSSTSMPSQQPLSVKFLVDAIKSGQVHDMKTILGTGVNVEEEHEGQRPLFHAIKTKNIATVDALREYAGTKLDLGTANTEHRTPLMLAAEQGDPELVDLLLVMGAHVDETPETGTGQTPLMLAAEGGYFKVVATLLSWEAECQVYARGGWSALHCAVQGKGAGDLLRLFTGKVDVDIPTKGDHETPITMLSKHYDDTDLWWDKFEALVDMGADVNKTNAGGYCPLLIAMEDNSVKLANYLITRLGALVPPGYEDIHLTSDMLKVVKQAKKMEKSRAPRRNSSLSLTSSRMSGVFRKPKS